MGAHCSIFNLRLQRVLIATAAKFVAVNFTRSEQQLAMLNIVTINQLVCTNKIVIITHLPTFIQQRNNLMRSFLTESFSESQHHEEIKWSCNLGLFDEIIALLLLFFHEQIVGAGLCTQKRLNLASDGFRNQLVESCSDHRSGVVAASVVRR